MARKEEPAEWTLRRMDELEEESKNWPAWKKDELEERLRRDGIRLTEPASPRRAK